MEILLVTSSNALLGLAGRLVDEGHTVKLWGSSSSNCFAERVKHPYEHIQKCDFIVAEDASDMQVLNWAKKFNRPVIGAHPFADMLNKDVTKEYEVETKLGLPLPPTEIIHDVADMYDKVIGWNSARTMIRYDRVNISCDHQKWLAWAMTKLPVNKQVLLQKPTWGEELQVFGWFDGLRWARPFFLKTPTEDRLRASSVLSLFKREWLSKVITPWEGFLRQIGYKGPMRVKAYVSKQNIQVFEAYMGFEFPSFYAFLESLKEPVGSFLHRVAYSVCEEINTTTDYASCAVVGTTLDEPEGAPIVGLDEGNRKHIFFGNVDRAEEDIVISRKPEWVYTVSAHGRTLEESFGRLYFTQDKVRIPDPNIMTGIRPVHEQWFNRIRDLGYL